MVESKPIKVKNGSITFDCPECGKSVDFMQAFREEPIERDINRVSVACPFCDAVEIAHYTNNRIRARTKRLRQLRANPSESRMKEYYKLQQTHIKYHDAFNAKMKAQFG